MFNLSRRIYFVIIMVLFAVVSFFHIWRLSSVPRGLFLDETSIGHNAYLIAQNGLDEHGVSWPVFFKAYGEYKNPLYIYGAALLFKLFGVSEFTLRLTSVVFMLAFVILLFILSRTVFPKYRELHVYSIVAAGFLPWFFAMSRVGFEVISQVAIVTAAILLVYLAYEHNRRWIDAFFAGLLIGISVYTYSTARLLSFLLLISLVVVYSAKSYWHIHARMLAGFLIAIIPYALFALANPGALSSRFNLVTYLYDSSISIFGKMIIFIGNYFYYISPRYLLFAGDSQLRHHSGFHGEVFLTVAVLFIIALIRLIKGRQIYRNRFTLFLSAQLLLAPVAAALTTGDSSLRSLLLGLYILIFSFWAFDFMAQIPYRLKRRLVIVIVSLALIVESSFYLVNYFKEFPEKSASAFGTYAVGDLIALAIKENPSQIVVSSSIGDYTTTNFYQDIYGNMVPIKNDVLKASPGTCLIKRLQEQIDADEGAVRLMEITPQYSQASLVCYKN